MRQRFAKREAEGVFVVRDGIATFRPVKVGVAGDEYFEVVDGLREGETIVAGTYQAIRDLKDGAKVRAGRHHQDPGSDPLLMRLLEAVRMALSTLRAQKLKSFFSLIGVLIGVTFLIAVVSIVQGMNRYMVDQFANTLVGANTFELRQRPSIVTGNVSDEVWLAWRRRPRISYDDADYVRERIRTPATFAKFCEDYVSVHYGGKVAKSIRLVGTEESYFQIRNYEIVAGRAFTSQEVRTAQPVLVIGQEVADKLLKGVDPIGKRGRDRWPSVPGDRRGGQAGQPVRDLHGQVRDHAVQRPGGG